jgi:hypothetical protein
MQNGNPFLLDIKFKINSNVSRLLWHLFYYYINSSNSYIFRIITSSSLVRIDKVKAFYEVLVFKSIQSALR